MSTPTGKAAGGRRKLKLRLRVVVLAIAVPAMLLGLWALGDALNPPRKGGGPPGPATNLHNIGLGLEMYISDEGRFPPTLEHLVPLNYCKLPAVFHYGGDPAPEQRGSQGFLYSFDYVGELPGDVPPWTVICYMRKGYKENGRYCLRADGSVEFFTEEDSVWQGKPAGIADQLTASYAAVVSAFGEELTPERDAKLRAFYEAEG